MPEPAARYDRTRFAEPQQGQLSGAAMTMRLRGR
jgi:hypothetical protein